MDPVVPGPCGTPGGRVPVYGGAGGYRRPVEDERENTFLTAHCAHLRHGCIF